MLRDCTKTPDAKKQDLLVKFADRAKEQAANRMKLRSGNEVGSRIKKEKPTVYQLQRKDAKAISFNLDQDDQYVDMLRVLRADF